MHVREYPLEPAALVLLVPTAGSTAVKDPSGYLLFAGGHSEELDLALLSRAKEEFGSLAKGATEDFPALQTVCGKEKVNDLCSGCIHDGQSWHVQCT